MLAWEVKESLKRIQPANDVGVLRRILASDIRYSGWGKDYMSQSLKPLSGRGEDITYQKVPGGRCVKWGNTSFKLPNDLVVKIVNQFFEDDGWHHLGANMTDPTPGGLGEFIGLESKLSSRHASAVAAIMVDDALLEYRDTKPIKLRKVPQVNAKLAERREDEVRLPDIRPSIKSFDFDRESGVVWVCDVRNSSRYISSDENVTHVEDFLPRLFWFGAGVTESAGGQLLKFTGDGFLAWFPSSGNDSVCDSRSAHAALRAAWDVSIMVNVTQLGLDSPIKFGIRHGITKQDEALRININEIDGHESIDLLGRDVVLAFRLSGMSADFPHINTTCDVVKLASRYAKVWHFVPRPLSREDSLRYLKGETYMAESVGAVDYRGSCYSTDAEELKRNAYHRAAGSALRDVSYARRLVSYLESGPSWTREVLDLYIQYLHETRGLIARLAEVANTVESN